MIDPQAEKATRVTQVLTGFGRVAAVPLDPRQARLPTPTELANLARRPSPTVRNPGPFLDTTNPALNPEAFR